MTPLTEMRLDINVSKINFTQKNTLTEKYKCVCNIHVWVAYTC